MGTSRIEAAEDALSVFTEGPPDKFTLAEISEISAYKRDELTVDTVCCDIVTESDGVRWTRTIHEDMAGFRDAIAQLESLPGFYRKWREDVVLPPFAENFTILYRRGLDFNEIYARTPSHTKISEDIEEETADPNWPWILLAAIVCVAVVLLA